MEKHKNNVLVNGNKINIYKMDNQFCVSDFIHCMQKARRFIKRKDNEYDDICVTCFCAREHIFPDACVPIAAIIHEFREQYGVKITVKIENNNYLKNCKFENPKQASTQIKNPLNKILYYDATDENGAQAAAINQALVNTMSRTIRCEDGVLAGMLWCVYEVLDNVIAHSNSSRGYFMAQYHKGTERIAICIYDCGMGIKESLKKGGIHTSSETQAIWQAMRDGVTDGTGQGNGLYGLSQIVQFNKGRLAISSGRATVMITPTKTKEWNNNPVIDNLHRSTTVDFQLELSNKTDLKNALRSIGGIEDFDIRIDDMSQENSNYLVYAVNKNTNDVSLRKSGKPLRIDVENILRRTKQPIIIDFSDIPICSSSFLDEFIAKLLLDLGAVNFNRLISLKRMNSDITYLCNRAIVKRINAEWISKNSG